MRQVEIIVEELKTETMKEFERIKNESSITSMSIKKDSKKKMEGILQNLRQNIHEIPKENLDREFLNQVNNFYKEAIKNIHSAQENSWSLLSDKTIEYKRQIKKCYEYACEIVNKKDKTLEQVYGASKEFLRSNLKESAKNIKKVAVNNQRQILLLCKDAKRRVKIET